MAGRSSPSRMLRRCWILMRSKAIRCVGQHRCRAVRVVPDWNPPYSWWIADAGAGQEAGASHPWGETWFSIIAILFNILSQAPAATVNKAGWNSNRRGLWSMPDRVLAVRYIADPDAFTVSTWRTAWSEMLSFAPNREQSTHPGRGRAGDTAWNATRLMTLPWALDCWYQRVLPPVKIRKCHKKTPVGANAPARVGPFQPHLRLQAHGHDHIAAVIVVRILDQTTAVRVTE